LQGEKEIYLRWESVNDIAASRLVEFHSHTANHVLCSDIRMADLITELRDSKEIIEKELGKPCECLCWPYGAYSKEAVEAAKSVGYKAIFTANPGVVRRYSDPLCINRLKITDGIFMLKVKMTCTNPYLSELFFTIRGFLVACKRWLRRGVSKNQ
jgi:peptidoglycan/xylan/chitin deacetylase (PgdA/CDA1 family)